MKQIIVILLSSFLTAFPSLSAKKTVVTELPALNPTELKFPLQVDSVNLKGDKFGDKELLKMPVTIPEQDKFTIKLNADTAGWFYTETPEKNKNTVQLFSFYVNSDRYAKGNVKVTSPDMFEIYVDNKLETNKLTKQDSLNSSMHGTVQIKPYPSGNRIVIKLLSFGNDSIVPALKVEIENEEKDSVTNFSVSYTGRHFLSFNDLIVGKRITRTSISPEGNYVLISYRNTFGEKYENSTDLYHIKTKKSVLLDINGQKKQLNWMPGSEKLYYVSTANGTDIISIDPNTLTEEILARNIPTGTIRFSPDEQSFFYSKADNGEEKNADLSLLASPRARQGNYLNRSFIHRYDLSTGVSQQITFGSSSTSLNDISPDAKEILFAMWEETITERPFAKYSMFKLNLETMKIDTLWYQDPFAYQAVFSPDGNKVLVTGAGDAFNGIGLNIAPDQISNTYNRSAFIMDLATKEIDAFTKNFDPSITSALWNKKDKMIYLLTTDKDFQNVYTYDTANKRFTKLPWEEEYIRHISLSANSNNVSYFGVSLSNSTRAYVYDIKSRKSTEIADPSGKRLEELILGDVRDWNFTNSEGMEISGRYYLPPNFNASKEYPLIVYYYGGTNPTGRTFESSYPGHAYAAQGYVVYVVQPAGAIGFGQKFAAMHVNAWGKRTAEDIIEGTQKFMAEHTFINKDKVGCIGASYGGFMTMYLLTQTDLFAAAVSHAGISSISSYWGEGYWGYSYSSAASAYSYPWNNRDLYVNQSPLFNADKINTPLLLTHGKEDTNVPPGESIQMYTALKILGKPVEFIQVDKENHGISNYKRRLEWFDSIMAWFNKWLKDDAEWWDDIWRGLP